MITRSRAKMASNSDSVVETPDDRARGPSPTHQEVNLQTLMALISEKLDKQSEEFRTQIGENSRIIREEISENNRLVSEKLDQNKEEMKQQVAEQIAQMRSEIREGMNTLKADRSEVQKKQEEEVNKDYEDVRKVRDTDNAVNFTDVSTNKKLSTVGSNANVISKPRKKWVKKRNDFVSRYLTMSEDDYHDMDRGNNNLIPSNRMRKRHKFNDTRADTASVKPMVNYLECGIDTHRLSSRAAAIRSMKRKFDIKRNTACYEAECKFKQTMDGVKPKTRQDPYVNSSWARNVTRKGRRMKFAERLKKIVSATSTERRYLALEIRFLKNQENKILSAYVCLLYTSHYSVSDASV